MLNLLSYRSKAQASSTHWTQWGRKAAHKTCPVSHPLFLSIFILISVYCWNLLLWGDPVQLWINTLLRVFPNAAEPQKTIKRFSIWDILPKGLEGTEVSCLFAVYLKYFLIFPHPRPQRGRTLTAGDPNTPIPSLHLHTCKAGAPPDVPMAQSLLLGFLLITSNTNPPAMMW